MACSCGASAASSSTASHPCCTSAPGMCGSSRSCTRPDGGQGVGARSVPTCQGIGPLGARSALPTGSRRAGWATEALFEGVGRELAHDQPGPLALDTPGQACEHVLRER